MSDKTRSLASSIFSESTVAIGIGIGVLLLWVASLVAIFGTGSDAFKAMKTLENTGVALISVMLISGGVANSQIERAIRIAMVVMGAIVLLVLVGIISGSSLFPY